MQQKIISLPSLSELLHARYGTAAPQLPANFHSVDTVLTSLLGHRSIRAYLPDALPDGTLELLLASAQSASTSSNLQAWSVIAIEETDRKARLASLCRDQRHIHEAPLFLVWLADLSRLRRIAEAQHLPAEALDYFESFVLAVIDATLAAQNAVIAAESLGLGTVYIGAIRNEPEKVAAELRLPPEVLPVFGLVVGRPDPNRPAAEIKPRLPISAVLHRETYQTEHESGDWESYNANLARFQASQNLPITPWTTQAAERVAGAQALGSRAHLAEAIKNLGFKLK